MSKRRKTQHAPRTTTRDPPQPEQPQAREKSWIELATETEPLCAIPVLPRFQADLPDWTGNCQDPDSIKWLGEQILPLQESEDSRNDSTQDNNKVVIGKGIPEICTSQIPGSGRPEICSCQSPASVECVNRHITEERNKLKIELGPAFKEWKFDQMGGEVSSAWFSREEKRFEALVRRNVSENQSSVESSWKSFRGKDRKSLVSYYFNVYIPRKISQQTRSGCTDVQTDDDVPSNSLNFKSENLEPNNNSQEKGTKSETADDEASKSRKSSESQKKSANYARKNKYLAGRR